VYEAERITGRQQQTNYIIIQHITANSTKINLNACTVFDMIFKETIDITRKNSKQ